MRSSASRTAVAVVALMVASSLSGCGADWLKGPTCGPSAGSYSSCPDQPMITSWHGWPEGATAGPSLDQPLVAFAVESLQGVDSRAELASSGTILLQDAQAHAVAGTSRLVKGPDRVEFRPSVPLQVGVTYIATLTGAQTVKGASGNWSWSFTPQWPASLDATFGLDGAFVAEATRATLLVPQPGGWTILAGSRYTGAIRDVVLSRVDTAGMLDLAFGRGGEVVLDGALLGFPGEHPMPEAHALTVDPAGRVLLAGPWNGAEWAVVRIDASGTLDASFGAGGVVRGAAPLETWRAGPLRTLPDGRILAGVSTRRWADAPEGRIYRLLDGGTIDTAYGAGGLARSRGSMVGFEPLPDGRVVAASSDRFALTRLERFDATGMADATFGAGGVINGGPLSVDAFTVDASGRLLIAGSVVGLPWLPVGVLRLTGDAQPDASFGGGSPVIPVSDTGSSANLALGLDGRIAVGRTGWPVAVAWLTPDGLVVRTDQLPPGVSCQDGLGALAFDAAGRLSVAATLEQAWGSTTWGYGALAAFRFD